MNKEGFIIRSNAGLYDVFCEDKIYVSKPRGKFRKEFKHPLVGDNVIIEVLNDNETAVDLYSMASLNWKATQELYELYEDLSLKINTLQNIDREKGEINNEIDK